ncbi:hypothetical protein Q8G41_27800, partial [Klebsiella pneumoniae]|uniref:hypothetical protein n=1 Tax=Klebsiella pneumoniae TaxID=573 RepID=UPI003013BDC1
MSYPGVLLSFSILGVLASSFNSRRACARDEMGHDSGEKSNHAMEASPAASGHAERWLYEEGHGQQKSGTQNENGTD